MAITRTRRSKLDPYLDKLGFLPDRELADLAGVSAQNVRAYRKRRGIPATWRGEGVASAVGDRPKRRARRGKLTPFLEKIGILSDATIAKMAQATSANVRAYRLRHDIPARWRGEGEPLPNEQDILALHLGLQPTQAPEEPTDAPVAVPEPPVVDDQLPPEPDELPTPALRGLQGYEVKVRGPVGVEMFVVTGTDIADAAGNALRAWDARSTEGELVALRHVAGLLM